MHTELDHQDSKVDKPQPWGANTTNPSNSIVSSLPRHIESKSPSHPTVRIITHSPIRVSYGPIPTLVPGLIATTQPDLILHVGLDSGRSSYNIEQSSGRTGFFSPDVDGRRWSQEESDEIWPGDTFDERLLSAFDVVEVRRRCGDVRAAEIGPSDGVGRYLCGFLFYTTLAWYELQERGGDKPVLFLHVPVCPTEEDVKTGQEVVIEVIRNMVEIWLESRQKKPKRTMKDT